MKVPTHGSHKRYDQIWTPPAIARDETVPTEESETYVKSYHSWHFAENGSEPQTLELDGHALGMYNAMQQAVNDYIAHQSLAAVYVIKLKFAHSDVLRATHKAMRSGQFAGTFNKTVPLFKESIDARRRKANVDEFTAGLHRWRRIMKIHFGSYRSAAARKLEGSLSSKIAMAEAVSITTTSFCNPLSAEEILRQTMLVRAPGGCCFSSADAREWFRNRRSEFFRTDLGAKVRAALAELQSAGLIEEMDVSGTVEVQSTARAAKRMSKGGMKRGGRPAQFYKKRSAAHVATQDSALAVLKKLRVTLSEFP